MSVEKTSDLGLVASYKVFHFVQFFMFPVTPSRRLLVALAPAFSLRSTCWRLVVRDVGFPYYGATPWMLCAM